MNQTQFYANLFAPSNIARRSTSIIQYPAVAAGLVIQSQRVILKFVHQGQIYIPEQILLSPTDHTVIVCADAAFKSPARKRIVRCLHDMIQRHAESSTSTLRVLLPTSFRASGKEFEYIDLNIQDAMHFV